MKSVAYGGVPTLIPERVIAASNYRGESEQTSTTVYVSDRSEWVVSANCDTGNINIVWRSRDTLEVVATQRVKSSDFGDPSGGENYIQCSVVCSQQFNHTLVVAVRLDGEIDYIYCSDAGVTPTVTSSGLTVSMAANVNSNIDLASYPGGNNAVLIYNDGANVNVRMVGIAPPHATNWTTTVFSPPTQYTMCALDPTPGIELLWSVASSDPFGATRTLRMGVLNFGSGAAIATSGASTTPSPWIPGIPFCSHDDNVGGQGVHFLATTTINASTFEPISRLYVWDKVNGSALQSIDAWPDAVVAGRVMLNSIATPSGDEPYYTDATFPRLLLPMMQSGWSDLDTDIAYDPGRPVFLQLIGALIVEGEGDEDMSIEYNPHGPAEQGLLAMNGEVGQATHPFISCLESGATGWTMGAPARICRINSNSGDNDTDLTGAYVTTFDVATPGKSRRFWGLQWRTPLLGLPRQGRIAIFKPMRADQCALSDSRLNETIIPGLTPHVCDGTATHSMGFLEAPVMSDWTAVPAGTSFSGTYTVTAVYEWTDAEGRRYQSAPAIPREVTLAAGDQASINFASPVAGYTGMAVAVYRTVNGGSEFKRDGSFTSTAAFSRHAIFRLDDTQLLAQESLYTSLGELPNDPPPSAKRFAKTRDRVWACGLDRPEVVQASKLLADGRGVVWSNAANYFLVLPEPVIAIETLDETAVVFTERGVYTIGGSGPDDTGIGTFAEPGRIPGYVGCVSARSVVSADAGIYFQSQRGIELLPRGFGAAQWVGQPVMTDLETYSTCRGVVADSAGDRIVWSMANQEDWSERLLVLDCRTQSWSAWDVPQLIAAGVDPTSTTPTMGLSTGAENPVRGTGTGDKRVILWGDSSNTCRVQQRDNCEDTLILAGAFDTVGVTATWETGWVRFAGTSNYQIIRRAGFLLTASDDDWTFTVVARFNDQEADTYTATWVGTDVPFEDDGSSVTLEYAMPVVQFESVKLTITVTASDSPSLQLHSIALYPETEGPRVRKEWRR